MLVRLQALWQHTFLHEVLQRDRWLGVAFAIFFVGQSIAQLLRVELTPFFLFGMYSEPIHPKTEYDRVAVTLDGKPLTQEQMPRFAGELFFSTLYRFQHLHDRAFEDHYAYTLDHKLHALPSGLKTRLNAGLSFCAEDVEAFGAWALRYVVAVMGKEVGTIRIEHHTYRYVGQHPRSHTTTTLYETPAP